MDSTLDVFSGQLGEPALDLIEPTGRDGRDVHLPMRSAGKPRVHLWRLVGGIVVHHQMSLRTLWQAAVQRLEDDRKRLCAVPRVACDGHRPGRDIQRSKQRRVECAYPVPGWTRDLAVAGWPRREKRFSSGTRPRTKSGARGRETPTGQTRWPSQRFNVPQRAGGVGGLRGVHPTAVRYGALQTACATFHLTARRDQGPWRPPCWSGRPRSAEHSGPCPKASAPPCACATVLPEHRAPHR